MITKMIDYILKQWKLMKEFNKKKIGIIGLGKRFDNVYRQILEKLGCKIYVWNRTKEKALKYANNQKYVICDTLEDIKNSNLDACLSFIPGEVNFELLGKLDLNCILLIETPVLDKRWIDKNNVGVLEQWPYLPVEQMKEKIYLAGLIERPYWSFNDGRSFDYHAIAQIRKYSQSKKPTQFSGVMQRIPNPKGFIDKNDKINFTPDEWTHGTVVLEGGEVIMHSFAYNCKVTNLKPYQLLRAYSSDGSLTSGRVYEMDNDYEQFEIRYLDNERRTVVKKICKEFKNDNFFRLTIKDTQVFWENKYCEINFNDQEIAISDLILNAMSNKIYTTENAFYDFLTMNAIKQSAINSQTLRL